VADARARLPRYVAAQHAMQAGVAVDEGRGSKSLQPKFLRVGINTAMCDHAALVRLLIAKGVLTEEEYLGAIADEMEREAKRYEARLSEELGTKVTLV